jgi:D-alanyl-D-alanine carboxypeptidase
MALTLSVGLSACQKKDAAPPIQQHKVYTVDQGAQAAPAAAVATTQANTASPEAAAPEAAMPTQANPVAGTADPSLLQKVLAQAALPESLVESITASNASGPSFLMDLLGVVGGNTSLYALVDKTHPLPQGYVPPGLMTLPRANASYTVSRKGLQLRTTAEQALETMAEAAKKDGVTLLVSSTYRSYDYQKVAYQRAIDEDGQVQADRESAKPGYSQHQTGLVIDFGSIDDSFANTKAGKWLEVNAGRYGWSLSFPKGYESATGYRWECWHYRYVGTDLAHFINTYFMGIQQYALQFINAWVTNK